MKYLRVFKTFFANNLSVSTEYRKNFLIQGVVAVSWICLQLGVIQLFFSFTNDIYGWTQSETLLLIGVFRITKGVFDIFIRPNLFALPEDITSGNFDFILTKPMNALFLQSFKKQLMSEIPSLFLGFLIAGYAIFSLHLGGSGFYLSFAIMVSSSFVAYCSIFLMLLSLSFFTTRFTAISETQAVLSESMRFPTDILSRNSLALELLIIPFALMVTWPTKVLVGKLPPGYLFLDLALVAVLAVCAYLFWRFALRHYSSASS